MSTMTKLTYTRLTVALLLCWTVSASAQQSSSQADGQTVIVKGTKNPSKWFRAESQHFVVVSDTRRDDVVQLLNNLEKLDYLLRIYTRDYRTGSAAIEKMTVYFHDRMDGFEQVATHHPDEAVGLYCSCSAGVQGHAVNLDPIQSLHNEELAQAPLNESLSYIFEAYARHFLYRYTNIRSPASFVDGFAQYFSSVRFSDNQMAVGRAPASDAGYLYFLDQGHRYKLTYEDVLTADEAAQGARLEYLARAWELTHYMLSTDDNRKRLAQYLELVHDDVPAGQAFQRAFGKSVDQLDNLMWRYRLHGLEVRRVDLPTLPAARLSFTELPDSDTPFVLADAILKSCPERAVGESLLGKLTRESAGKRLSHFARMTLSRAQIDWGNPKDALPYLTEAIGHNGADFEAVYLSGLANLRVWEQRQDTASLQAAKRDLARARTLDPASAQAAYAAYRAELDGGKPDQATLEAAVAAWRNGHEVDAFARSAALALAYLGKGSEADTALALLSQNAGDPEMASWAKTWESRLAKGVTRADLLAEMRRASSPSGVKEWTVATKYLLSTTVQNEGLEEARGFLEAQQLNNPMDDAMSGKTPVTVPLRK
jgi:hypothetical protein